MNHSTNKVYVIQDSKPKVSAPPLPSETPAEKAQSQSTTSGGNARRRLWLAYAAGGVSLPFWTRGIPRVLWGLVALLAALSTLFLVTSSGFFMNWLQQVSGGAVLWLIVFLGPIVLGVVAWSRAIFVANRGGWHGYPEWMNRTPVLLLLALLIPGIGYAKTGAARRAALAFGLLAPATCALAVLANWRWLWERTQSGVPAGISSGTMELMLVMAAGTLALCALAWIAQALDGARRTSSGPSVFVSGLTSACLLAAVTLFAMTYQPPTIASNMDVISRTLSAQGFRVIPLHLSESAARLDPGEPGYLARAADLNELMGMEVEAQRKRATIQMRMSRYFSLVDAETIHRLAPGNPEVARTRVRVESAHSVMARTIATF